MHLFNFPTNHTAPSNKTVSVTVKNPAGNAILTLKPTGLNTTMEGGLYRYQGTSVNNYICFGISTKSTCRYKFKRAVKTNYK